jgi:hypothetical protein
MINVMSSKELVSVVVKLRDRDVIQVIVFGTYKKNCIFYCLRLLLSVNGTLIGTLFSVFLKAGVNVVFCFHKLFSKVRKDYSHYGFALLF